MKRILIFSTTYFPFVGGAEVAMKETTDRLPEFEFDLICAKLRSGLANTERIGAITVHRVGFGRSVDKYLLPLFALWKTLFLSRPDVIWSLMASYGGFAALVYSWFHPNIKMVLTLQEGDPLEHYAKRTGRLTFLHKKIFERATVVQAISKFLASWAKQMGFKGEPQVVPNGVDLPRFTKIISKDERRVLRVQLGYEETDVVLVTASRLSLKNGVDDLIRSLVFLPLNYKTLIIGAGEDEKKLKTLVDQKQLQSRVLFLGKKSHDELPALLQASDIFVRASLSEGLGNSFLEAMASSLPIIGTPVGGIPDFLRDEETGVFCAPRDPESIAHAAIRIMTEIGLNQKLIQQGRALVQDNYGWEKIAQEIGKIL